MIMLLLGAVIIWKVFTDLIDEGHCINQQLCIHTILLIKDLDDVRPKFCACRSKKADNILYITRQTVANNKKS